MALLICALGEVASAQSSGFRLDRYEPTIPGNRLFMVERPWYAETRWAAVGFTLGYAHNPLRFSDGSAAAADPIVAHALTGYFDVAGSPGRWLLVRIGLPMTFVERGTADPQTGVGPLVGFAAGDARVSVMVPIWGQAERDRFSLHLGADAWISVAGADRHQGDENGKLLLPRLVVAGAFRQRWRYTIDAGFLYRPAAVIGTAGNQLVAGSEVQLGAALGFLTAAERLHIGLELRLTARVTAFDLGSADVAMLDVLLGAQYHIVEQILVGAAVGTDVLGTTGAPDFRALFRVAWAPGKAKNAPPSDEPAYVYPQAVEQPRKAPLSHAAGLTGPPIADADGDGIPDELDRCPYEPEDMNGVRDDDGCPESPASAGAALLLKPKPVEPPTANPSATGAAPAKPTEPATSGSPPTAVSSEAPAPAPLDTDGDGIPDFEDRCPLSPEDIDGFEDDDGCPDLDNDGDGIPDAQDKCPLEAETVNGIDDEDGCPDAGPARVEVANGRIELKEQVRFRLGKEEIDPQSYSLMREVVAIMRAHPEFKVEVQGHTDDKGDAARNLALSQQRAERVRDFLIKEGIAAARLIAKGYGSTRPRVSNNTRQGQAENRRVELWLAGGGK